MQKMLRSYGGQPQLVLDFVRSTIVANTIFDVVRVVSLVIESANVHVIKNRFDPRYDGSDTNGYRDVNLQLSLSQLEGTPFAGFIFELQVHLRAILAHKNTSGHAAFSSARNIVGC